MLNAAQEAVVVTVDALYLDRQLASARIGVYANPPMSTDEASTIARLLAGEGYLLERHDDGTLYYELTHQGVKYVQSLIERES
jgi:predicted transcriptional regulator